MREPDMPTDVISSPPDQTPPQPRRILYAEDMSALRILLQETLGRDGHEIHGCEHGEAAWQMLSAQPDRFDLLITDHHMPVLNGLGLVQRLRTSGIFAGKIVVFSSELSEAVDQAYRDLAVDCILKKPVLRQTLRRMLADLWRNTTPSRSTAPTAK
jgi:CheY-like chemotaxis protein